MAYFLIHRILSLSLLHLDSISFRVFYYFSFLAVRCFILFQLPHMVTLLPRPAPIGKRAVHSGKLDKRIRKNRQKQGEGRGGTPKYNGPDQQRPCLERNYIHTHIYIYIYVRVAITQCGNIQARRGTKTKERNIKIIEKKGEINKKKQLNNIVRSFSLS